MIRIKLRQAIDDRSFAQGRRITLKEVAEAIGMSRQTLSRLANEPGYNTDLATLDALCRFLDCTPGELLEYVPEEDVPVKKEGASE